MHDWCGSRTGNEGCVIRADWVGDGHLSLRALSGQTYGAVMLRLSLPKCDGMDMLHQLRAGVTQVTAPVITARVTLADRISGSDAGGDDYIFKPFEMGSCWHECEQFSGGVR
jgi:DNA-binding response OmpR family regulator